MHKMLGCKELQRQLLESMVGSGGSRKLGRGGGATVGGRLRQKQVLAVCTEGSTGKSPPSLIIMALKGGGGAPGAIPPPKKKIRAW